MKDFETVFEEQIQRSRDILLKKAKEYATDEDRYHNFNAAAVLQNCTPRQALGGFMAKHVISIFDMIWSSYIFSREQWDEKITDNINYLILLKGLLENEFYPDAQTICSELERESFIKSQEF